MPLQSCSSVINVCEVCVIFISIFGAVNGGPGYSLIPSISPKIDKEFPETVNEGLRSLGKFDDGLAQHLKSYLGQTFYLRTHRRSVRQVRPVTPESENDHANFVTHQTPTYRPHQSQYQRQFQQSYLISPDSNPVAKPMFQAVAVTPE